MPAEPKAIEALPLELLRPISGRHLEAILPLLAPLQLTALDTLTLGDLLTLGDAGHDPHLTAVSYTHLRAHETS